MHPLAAPRTSRPVRLSRPLRRLGALATVGALSLGLVGCAASEDGQDGGRTASAEARPSATADPDGPRLLQGGEPGQAAEEVAPGTTLPTNDWSQDDATFMSQMVPHHAQALEMTALVADRSDDAGVRRLARRISAAQGPEIQMMSAWLAERDLDVPSADDHGAGGHDSHGGQTHLMSGMLTQDQLDELAAARGTAFDRLFLTSMIRHHQGALEMADETAGGGLDVLVGEQRDGITSDQSAEIARMRQLLDRL